MHNSQQLNLLTLMFKGKTLMITGGTGSFGHAVLKHFLTSDVKEIRIFSRDEKKQEDMRIKYKNDKINNLETYGIYGGMGGN